MIPIETEKRINWHKVRAEYIAGTSQRKLAEKYGCNRAAIERRCRIEKWSEARNDARAKVQEKIIQKTAEKAADNATIAADLKKNLLLRLQRIEEHYPMDATEVKTKIGNSWAVYRIRDLTAAYKDLTEDLQTASNGNELLRSLLELERRTGQ